MPNPLAEPYDMYSLDAILDASTLIEYFESEDPRYGDAFFAADRDTLAALVMFATLAIKSLATATDDNSRSTRLIIRQLLTDKVAEFKAQGEAS